MGMDISGKKPKNEAGSYFRASIWSWRVIHRLIGIVGAAKRGKLISKRLYQSMANNDGAGLKKQDRCDVLANELERIADNPAIVKEFGLTIAEEDGETILAFSDDIETSFTDKEGHFLRQGEVPVGGRIAAHSTSLAHVRQFIEFLRNCGGFEVW